MKLARARLAPLAGAALALACATQQPAVPYCAESEALPPPAAACAGAPEVRRVREELEAIAVPEARFNLVRVAFDDESRVGALCVQRARDTDGWSARKKLSAREAALRAVAPGPACLAGTSLELNRLGARRAEIDRIAGDCRREASALPAAFGRVYRSCIEREQIQRGEIWMLELGQIYLRTPEAAERRAALIACTQDATEIGNPVDPDSDLVYAPPAVTSCLRSRGWEPLE